MKPLSFCLLCFRTTVGILKGNNFEIQKRREAVHYFAPRHSVPGQAGLTRSAEGGGDDPCMFLFPDWVLAGGGLVVVVIYGQFKRKIFPLLPSFIALLIHSTRCVLNEPLCQIILGAEGKSIDRKRKPLGFGFGFFFSYCLIKKEELVNK